ncbi:MAG: DUF262 domain-containing protein [Chloroflexi bacterium]|nr:DUF262 domain-containing protein [Chloroflexota bacterium]
MTNFETHPKKLKDELLSSIHIRETALPDFQRDFVWQPGQTLSLLVSLTGASRRHPARLESSNRIFQARASPAPRNSTATRPSTSILDGQQRLSSLYQALMARGSSLLHRLPQAACGRRHRRGTRLLPPRDRRKLLRHNREAGEIWRAAAAGYLRRRGFLCLAVHPVVTLKEGISVEAVCTIFETLNNTGVRLACSACWRPASSRRMSTCASSGPMRSTPRS